MIRPNPALHYISKMLSKGANLDILLNNTGIQFDSLRDPGYLISLDSYKQLLLNIVEFDNSGPTGLQMGSNNNYGDYGIMAYAGISAQNIQEGIEKVWQTFGSCFGFLARPNINYNFADAEKACIEFSVPWVEESLYRFSLEEALCILTNLGTYIVGDAPAIEKIELSYPAPLYSEKYAETFNCPITFNTICTRFIVSKSWITAPLLTTDSEVNALCLEKLNNIIKHSEINTEIEQNIRNILIGQLHKPPHIDEIAACFGVSSRTLARQLQDRGTSYRLIIEKLRRDMATNWLNTTQLQAKEISYRLGYKDTGTFRRAFKNWTGQTINQYRNNVH